MSKDQGVFFRENKKFPIFHIAMSKRKKKSTPAENLIESLMDDVREIQADSSIHRDSKKLSEEATRIASGKKPQNSGEMWESLEKDVGLELDHSEFEGGFSAQEDESEYSSGEQADDYDVSSVGEYSDGPLEMPMGFENLPVSERFSVGPSADEDQYQGPSMDGGYQNMEDLERPAFAASESSSDDFISSLPDDDEATRPVMAGGSSAVEDKTVSIQDISMTAGVSGTKSGTSSSDSDKTVAVEGFANARVGSRKSSDVDVKVSVGNFRGSSRGAANVMTSVDASLAQAENLKLAQQRILELEREVENLRSENEELASAGEIIRTRTDELGVRITAMERDKAEIQESHQSEILILKGNLQYKENEVAKARVKVEELETRLKSDFKKIRVRERELENRLELLRAEKAALVRSKDEYILDQKRKIDQLSQELDNYRKKCLELNKTIEGNQDQFKRTERALRLALSNLEVKEESLVPLKKAE